MRKAIIPLILACGACTTQASIFQYAVVLDGPTEGATNTSLGTGSGEVDYDNTAHTLSLSVTFAGLAGTVTASHIHAATTEAFKGTAGVATPTPTFPGFPSGVTSGTYSAVLDLTSAASFNGSFVTANGGTPASAEQSLIAAFDAGKAYWNIHSTAFPGGEIRGFLVPVPEPSVLALASLGACGLGLMIRGRRR
jgi:hypothetical protein